MAMTRFFIFLAGLAIIGLAPAASAFAVDGPREALLRDRATVTAEVVTLGDLFMNAGDQADTPIARAPEPGARAAIAADHVARATRTAGLLWPNRERYTHLIVNRTGTEVPQELVSAALSDAAARHMGQADATYSIAFDRDPKPIFVAAGDTPDVEVSDFNFDARTGAFRAVLAPAYDGAPSQRVTGTAAEVRRVPVPAAAIARGSVITADMLAWTEMEASRLAPGTALAADDIIGLTPRSPLRRGQTVRLSDLDLPVAVAKDTLVTIEFRMPGMVLTARGRALENAPLGGLIRVLNTRSHRTVLARVLSAERVAVESDIPAEISSQATN